MQINFTKKFAKQRDKAPVKIQKTIDNRLKLFIKDPFSRLLNNHQLTGNFKKYHSINITGDWRAWYSTRGAIIFFEVVGTHSQLYG